jgi:hypothetical protein
MMNLKALYISLAAIALIAGCGKEPDHAGCTDPHAVNYDPRAIDSDGSCTYNEAEQLIWANGQAGGWNGDLIQGAFRPETCSGITQTLENLRDTVETFESLWLGTGEGSSHKSYFSLINEQKAPDYAEGSLRFDIRNKDGAAPPFMKLFICGKLTDDGQGCPQFLRSNYIEISTQSFNDSTFTEVNIPMREFEKITMGRVNVAAGFFFDGLPGTGVEINNLRWTADKY